MYVIHTSCGSSSSCCSSISNLWYTLFMLIGYMDNT